MLSRQTPFPTGLYQGCLICDTPSDYLQWVIDEGEPFGDEIKEVAQEEYTFRTNRKVHWRSCCAYKKN